MTKSASTPRDFNDANVASRSASVSASKITTRLPVAAASHKIPLEQSLAAYLQAVAANWVSAGLRLIPLGQTDGQRVTANLEPAVAATTKRALAAALDDAGSTVYRADIAAMRHETQYTRLFRS